MMTSKQKTRSLINKATTNDRNPTSGYLLNGLASRCSSVSECQTMENLLLKKLSKQHPYTKYKVLRIIKYLSENGSLHWCRIWQSHKNKLIEAQHFRGPSDPIYGDALNEQVRKAAKEALQSVFEQRQMHTPCRYVPTFNKNTSIKTTKVSNPCIQKPANNTKPKSIKKNGKIIENKRKKSKGKYEKQWVFDIVQSAGIGTKIKNMSKYVKQFENLNQKYVLKELNKILLDSMWQKQAKALVLIEALMNGKSNDYVINYFNEKIENIQSLQNSNKSVIRRKANAVIEYLDIEQESYNETTDETNNIHNQKVIFEQKQTVEIVDLFETISVNAVVENNQDNMFSGMNIAQNAAQNVDNASGEIIDFFSKKSEIENNAPISNGNSSVFGLDLNGQSAFGIDLNSPLNNKVSQQFMAPINVMPPQQFVMPQVMVSESNVFGSQYKYTDNALRYNNNDPFAEIMHGGISMQEYSQSKPKKNIVDPFAEFSLFGVEPMQS